jgi:hypothetical protein
MASVVAVFVGTNLNHNLYERFHPLMHVLPPLISLVVVTNHTPLVNLPL